MRITRALVAGAIALGLGAVTTPAAFAQDGAQNASGIAQTDCDVYAWGGSYGYGCFKKYGDYFYLNGANTGIRVVIQWKLGDNSRSGFIRWKPTDRYTNGVKNKDLPEEKYVKFRFGACYAGMGCDAPGDAEWFSGWKTTSVG